MASGDPFLIKQDAGGSSPWSYTATTDLVITSYATLDPIDNGTWVASTSGVRAIIPTPSTTTPFTKTAIIVLSGQTLTSVGGNLPYYGLCISGVEL